MRTRQHLTCKNTSMSMVLGRMFSCGILFIYHLGTAENMLRNMGKYL